MSLEFILQLTDSTCHNRFSSSLIDRDPDSFLSASWTYEDGWKLLLHDTYYTTSSTTQNILSSYLSKLQNDPHSIFTFGRASQQSISDIAVFERRVRRGFESLRGMFSESEEKLLKKCALGRI